MTEYGKDLAFDIILPRLKYMNIKQILMELSNQAAQNLNVSSVLLYQNLWAQEQKISSAIGQKLAIVHLKISGPQKPFLALATLNRDVDFGINDEQPVRIVAFLLSPEKDGPLHLRRLSRLSRFLDHNVLKERLIEARDEQAIRALLIDPDGWLIAA